MSLFYGPCMMLYSNALQEVSDEPFSNWVGAIKNPIDTLTSSNIFCTNRSIRYCSFCPVPSLD